MGYHNGVYTGWENWKPTYISGNTLWFDGSDINNFGQFSGEVVIWYDKSIGTTTLTYSSDFSTDAGGWWTGGNNVTITGATTIAGESGWLRVSDGTNVLVRHHAVRLNAFLDTTRVRITGTYFVPNESNLDGLYAGTGNNTTGTLINDFEKGKIKNFEVYAISNGQNDLTVGVTSGGTAVYTGDNNIYYIKNIKRYRLDGNHANQIVGIDRPSYANETLTFDGGNEYLDMTDHISLFSSDSQGEWFGVITTPSTHASVFSLGFESGTTYFYLGIEKEANIMRLTVWQIGSGANTKIKGTSGLSTDTTYILNISSNGSGYKMYINDILEPLSAITGSDNGNWISDMGGLTLIQKARFTATATIYTNLKEKEQIYFNRQLTNKERKAVFHYLNVKYSIY